LPYFVDSNVIIGYIFDNADSQGQYAKIVIGDAEGKYSGQTVKGECFGIDGNGKCRTVKKQIANEIRKIIAALHNGISLSDILNQMKEKECRTYLLIDDISKGYKNDTNLLIELLRDGQRDFESDCIDREDKIRDIIVFRTRKLPYTEIYNALNEHLEDKDDIEVILDAHDVGLEISALVLVSGNYRDITAFRKLISDKTSIKHVRSLKSFAPPMSFH
jgi:hypothetical protein